MSRPIRPLVLIVLVAALSACSPATTPVPASPTASASAAASTSPATSTSPAASSSISASPSAAAATPCDVEATEGPLRSDRLVGVSVLRGDGADLVLFRFGPSAPTSTNQPIGRLEPASPPFTMDPSGLPLEVPGSRFARVRFSGLILYDEAGTPTLTGPDRLDPAGGAAVRAVVKEGEFEGVSSWIIGFDGTGCVAVSPGDAATSIIRVEVAPTS
jgi:hypothetical protein